MGTVVNLNLHVIQFSAVLTGNEMSKYLKCAFDRSCHFANFQHILINALLS